MPSGSPLKQLRRLDRSSSKFHDRISSILYGEEYKQWVPTIQGDDLVGLVDYLDKALDNLDPASAAFRKCLRELRHVCGTRTILPPSYTLSSRDLAVGRQPVASGGSGDVYEGTLNGSRVCVKRIRIYSKDGPKKATKTLYQEAVVWKRLGHRNIVPLLGITPNPLQLISEWMPGGDLTEYIKKDPGADRLSLLSDVAEGLHFLHSRNVVHGDLKGPNILVDDAGHARITDFGLATVTQNLDSMRSTSEEQGHTARWTAPEILTEDGTYSKEADVFSFAMVMIEVFTGAVPFSNSPPAAATLAIMAGRRPPRPSHQQFTNQLWTLMQRSWDQDPVSRPEVSEVFKILCGRDPPPIKPTIYRLASASTLRSPSTLTVGRQQLFSGLNVSQPPSPLTTVSSFFRQVTPKRSGYSFTTLSPEIRGGYAGPYEDEDARPHTSSQVAIQGPSRRGTGESDSSQAPIDPLQLDSDELRKTQARNQANGRTHNALHSRNPSRKDVLSMDSGVDFDQGLDGGEGKYWVETKRSKGGSRSALNIGGVDQMSRNPSSMHLPHNLSKNKLAQDNKSKASLYHAGKSDSRPNLTNPSKLDLPGVDGHATGNPSRYELPTGTKSRHQSQLNLDKTLNENQDSPPPETQTHRDVQEPVSGQVNRAVISNSQTNGYRGNMVPEKNPKQHGPWCRLKQLLRGSKSRK